MTHSFNICDEFRNTNCKIQNTLNGPVYKDNTEYEFLDRLENYCWGMHSTIPSHPLSGLLSIHQNSRWMRPEIPTKHGR